MRLSVVVLTGWLALCWAAPARAEKKAPASPADLLPANTSAYAELQKPGLLAKECRELFKGSVLYNLPDSLADLEAKYPDHPAFQTMSFKMLGLLFAPEVVNEISKSPGSAVAFLGLHPDKAQPHPEFVFLIRPGTSNAPPFLLRMLMTMAPVKVKETVEGVKIYRTYSMVYGGKKVGPDGKAPPAQPPTIHEHDPSIATMKDYILIGSHQAVKDCILRARGKGEGESLAQNKDFQAAQKKVGGEPGLFVFVKIAGLIEFMKQVTKGAGPEMAQFLEAYTKAINPRAIRSSAMSLSLQKGTLHYHDVALLDREEKSPLLELIPSSAVSTDVLHFAPTDAVLAVAVSNGGGAERWNKLVKLLDEMLPAKALGGKKLSDVIRDVEEKLGVKLGPEVIGKTTNIGVALGNPLNAPFVITRTEGPSGIEETGAPQVPMVLILETVDEKAAQTLMELVVKVSQLAANKEVKPESKKIKGQSVSSIKLNAHDSVAYGMAGNTVVVGPHAESVALALADGAARKGLASDTRVMAQLKAFKDPIGVTVIKPGSLLASGVGLSGYKSISSRPKVVGPDGKEVPDKPGQPDQPKTTVTIRKDSPEQAKMKKELKDVLALEPWLVVGVTRGEGFITREAKSPGWDKFVPRIVNFAAEKTMEHYLDKGKGFDANPPRPDVKPIEPKKDPEPRRPQPGR